MAAVIIGDFNTTLSKHDISVNNTYRADISRNILLSIIKNNNLIDIWHTLNPRKRQFSHRQLVEGKLKQSHIDLSSGCEVQKENLLRKLHQKLMERSRLPQCTSQHQQTTEKRRFAVIK